MLYTEARDQIANGDLLFFRGRLLHSRLIQLWTRSVFSHVGIAVWIQAGPTRRLFCLEAMEGHGVRLFPLSRYVLRGDVVDWFALSDPAINRGDVTGWAMSHVGKRYASPWQFLRSFSLLSKRLMDWLRIPTRIDAERWFCSAFATEALLAGGWLPTEALDPSLSAPGDVSLFPCLQRQGQIEKE